MKRSPLSQFSIATGALVCAVAAAGFGTSIRGHSEIPDNDHGGTAQSALRPMRNGSGVAQTLSATGKLNPKNAFFQSIGTNGRACVTCHQPSEGWSVTPAGLQRRFAKSGGTDPIFRLNDGSVSPTADVSTEAKRRDAYSMLLHRGLIRVGLPIPKDAEFTLQNVDDPYHHASSADLSLFRRPLPSTNLPFLTTVMWDGRESAKGNTLAQNLSTQAIDATLGHAQGTVPPTQAQLDQIVSMETGLYTAQTYDRDAGDLDSYGATGGTDALASVDFYLGINDVLGADPKGNPFDPSAMTLYQTWANSPNAEQREVARGEVLFDTKEINIIGVAGLNDALGQPVIQGTCTTCHDTPNVGDHSLPLPIDIGLTDASRRTPDMPLYTLRNNKTGELKQTTDPGRALVTGKWKDIGKFKGPILRGLAARAPYFHNGFAANLDEVVDFYQTRFNVGFTDQEKRDLVAFLKTL